ncbi:hypothetical protein Aduo_007535 [Ancylostoma duodenale]
MAMAQQSEMKPPSLPTSSGSSDEPSTQTSGTAAQTPGTVAQTPGTAAQTPGTAAQTPGTAAQTPGTAVTPGATPAPVTPSTKRATTPLGSSGSTSQKDTMDKMEASKARLERINLQKRRQRRHKWSRRVGGCCRLILILAMGISVLLFVISSTALVFELAITEDSTWKLQPIPMSFEFEKFAVSSNSETCNEIGRTLFIEGHSIFGVAAGMVRCLAITEPHQSGTHGFDVALFLELGKTETCQQTAKRTRLPSVNAAHYQLSKLIAFEQIANLKSMPSLLTSKARRGAAMRDRYSKLEEAFHTSVNLTTTIRAYEALLSKMTDTERKTLELKFNRFRRNYPISNSFTTYLRVIGSEQLLRDEYSNTVEGNYRHATYSEGDIIETLPWPSGSNHAPLEHDYTDAPVADYLTVVYEPEDDNLDEVISPAVVPKEDNSSMYMNVTVPNPKEDNMSTYGNVTVPGADYSMSTEVNKAMEVLDDPSEELITWLNISTIELKTNHSACRPICDGNPHILIDLFNATDPSLNISAIGPERIDWAFLKPVISFYWDLHGLFRKLYYRRHHIFFQSKRNRRIRKRRDFPYSGNFFTILDKRKQQAIAYSGTARDSLGSTKSLKRSEMAEISLRPVIVFDNEIKLVVAGPGGEITESFEVPRMVQTLLLYLEHAEPLETAVTIPLLFPYSYRYTYHTEGLPWTFLKRFHKHGLGTEKQVRKLGKPGPLSRRDTLSAIEVRNGSFPVFFNRDETFIVVNGV